MCSFPWRFPQTWDGRFWGVKMWNILSYNIYHKSTEKKHFKLDTLMTTLALLTPDCTFLGFDFSDAYCPSSVFPPHIKYLRFNFDRQLYEFTCLPKWNVSCTKIFIKIMKVALIHIKNKLGMPISGYWLIIFWWIITIVKMPSWKKVFSRTVSEFRVYNQCSQRVWFD